MTYKHEIHDIDFAGNGTRRVCMTIRAYHNGVAVGSEIVFVHFDQEQEPVAANRNPWAPEVERHTQEIDADWARSCMKAAREAVRDLELTREKMHRANMARG